MPLVTGSSQSTTPAPFATITVQSADGALNPNSAGTYVVTKAGVCAMTLAAPTAGVDDGKIVEVVSTTANAHTLTATGLFQCGTAAVNLATFAAQAGASVMLMAYNAKWTVLSNNQITFS
jgi:hypothetical protein